MMQKPKRTYSLAQQIAEVTREIHERQGRYRDLVEGGRMSQEEADGLTDQMRAVWHTLTWLQKNEATVKAAVARKESA